jgi:hypothetical protein
MTKLFEENLRDSTVTDQTKQSPSGGRKAVENQPEPEGDRGTSGMSGSQQGNEDDDYAPAPERSREGEQERGEGHDDDPAWCVMESDILDGDRFLLVRDDLYSDEQLQQRITEEARSQADAIYTMTEMNHITSAELTDEDKRKLHDLKKEFGGQVLGDDPEGEAFPCVDISDWIDSRTG